MKHWRDTPDISPRKGRGMSSPALSTLLADAKLGAAYRRVRDAALRLATDAEHAEALARVNKDGDPMQDCAMYGAALRSDVALAVVTVLHTDLLVQRQMEERDGTSRDDKP